MSLITVDIGGTSIKSAFYDNGKLHEKAVFDTPDNLDEFYEKLTAQVESYKEKFSDIRGIAVSSPGAVNKITGVIEGASALPYIHDFDIHSAFEMRFALPVSIENDANCAALAEVKFGVAKGLKDVLFVVLGTGVGGAIVLDGEIHRGKHLFGGEFGFMLMDDAHSFSTLGTVVNMAIRYEERTSEKLTGLEIFNKAFDESDEIAREEVDIFTYNVAKGIFNLTYAFDPELIVIGGGVSRDLRLIPELNRQLRRITDIVEIAPFMPDIATCTYHNDANLLGAVVDFEQTYKLK